MHHFLRACTMAAIGSLTALAAHAGMGVAQLSGGEGHGPVTVFYPTLAADVAVQRGPFTLSMAPDARPQRGNQRLIVISHGSGGNAWVYSDLSRALVNAGYIVALPEHAGDNYKDLSKIGPESWLLRPLEVAHAIDVMAADTRFAPLFDAQRIGLWGMSAGGHTALTMAGGKWSRAQHLAHCEAHLVEDFAACTGGATELNGGVMDGVKKTVLMPIIRYRLSGDTGWHGHTDPRIQAIVAGVPYAIDFDLATLATPVVPLGLIQARGDIWLKPQFHSGPVIAACKACEVLADLPTAGHGALMSPLPPGVPDNIARLIADPAGFDRSTVPQLNALSVAFFNRHLGP
jgi:predicted dienelactone hydrolase